MSTSTTQSTSSSSTSQLGQINKQQLQNSFNSLISNYTSTTPPRIKLIDCFLLFLVVTGILEFAYRVLVTSHPFHAFAGGFGSVIGQFVLLAGLRAQVAPGRDTEFKQVSQERAFADFCAASIVLHVFAYNFLG